MLFSLYLDHVMIEWEDINLLHINNFRILHLSYAQVIMTASKDSLQELLH
jgi:hypothetical protein